MLGGEGGPHVSVSGVMGNHFQGQGVQPKHHCGLMGDCRGGGVDSDEM